MIELHVVLIPRKLQRGYRDRELMRNKAANMVSAFKISRILVFDQEGKKGYQHIFCIWKKCLKCKKLNNLASACRSKYKIDDINDTNSNNESDADVNELCIDHGGSSVNTKDNEITLDATLNDFNITPLNLILEHNVT